MLIDGKLTHGVCMWNYLEIWVIEGIFLPSQDKVSRTVSHCLICYMKI